VFVDPLRVLPETTSTRPVVDWSPAIAWGNATRPLAVPSADGGAV